MNWRFKALKNKLLYILRFFMSVILLLARIMRHCAEISELCHRMPFRVNYSWSHHRVLLEACDIRIYKMFNPKSSVVELFQTEIINKIGVL